MSWLLKLLPASTISALIADYVTKALARIDDKHKLALVAVAVRETSEAVCEVSKAVEDGTITEEEVDLVEHEITEAVSAIISATK